MNNRQQRKYQTYGLFRYRKLWKRLDRQQQTAYVAGRNPSYLLWIIKGKINFLVSMRIAKAGSHKRLYGAHREEVKKDTGENELPFEGSFAANAETAMSEATDMEWTVLLA